MVLRPTSFDFSRAGPVSSLNAAAISLVQLGADQVLVPVPNQQVKNDVDEGIEQLPPERQRAFKRIDSNGSILSLVEDYLEPLRNQAPSWPESGFVEALRNSFYNIALGCRHRACVARPRMGLVYDLLPVTDKSIFHGEAKYRFAELGYLLSQLDAYGLSRVEIVGEQFSKVVQSRIMDILESAQFRDIVQTEGMLGIARNPWVLLKALRRKVLALVENKRFGDITRAGAAISGLIGSPIDFGKVGELAKVLDSEKTYSPSLIELPPTLEYQIYSGSIQGREPPPGKIFAIEESVSDIRYWLDVGEERRITYDFESELSQMRRRIADGKKSLMVAGRYRGPDQVKGIDHVFHGGPFAPPEGWERYFKETFWNVR